jgi:hypothetical protein
LWLLLSLGGQKPSNDHLQPYSPNPFCNPTFSWDCGPFAHLLPGRLHGCLRAAQPPVFTFWLLSCAQRYMLQDADTVCV